MRHANRGISMIESLIGLVVLAMGVLALARLQMGNATESRHASARFTAVQMASELQERMVVNRAAMTPIPANNPYLTTFEASAAANTACDEAPCNAAQLAAWDLAQWKAKLASRLPDGNAEVFNVTNDFGAFGVLISWQDVGARNKAQAEADQQTADTALFDAADAVWHDPENPGVGVAGVDCPPRHICHLAHIRP